MSEAVLDAGVKYTNRSPRPKFAMKSRMPLGVNWEINGIATTIARSTSASAHETRGGGLLNVNRDLPIRCIQVGTPRQESNLLGLPGLPKFRAN